MAIRFPVSGTRTEGAGAGIAKLTGTKLAKRASRMGARFVFWAVALLGWVATAGTAAAQSVPEWNDPRALAAIARARAVRQSVAVDSAFRSYRADARGYVYFFIDRNDTKERSLIKADQIALEVYWQAPNQTRQRIVGLRDEKLLPTNVRYHLDHLTVVQDEFGDVIRLGDGDEVSAVTHPAAPGSEAVYDFRLADSLSIAFPGSRADTVRVYEIRVRPKDFEKPGFVGSVFLDRNTGAIVRMSFSFTPASYVDPYLDYIRISLDNSLWEGKYWLPYRQEAELRRELPQLDFLGGSVIRGRFEIGGYQLNVELPQTILRSARVTAATEEERLAFPFERPLFAQLEEEGLTPPPSLDEIREQVREIAADRYLSGLSRLRLNFPTASDVFRYNRAEGAFLGGGAVLHATTDLVLRGNLGYAFSAGHLSGGLQLTSSNPSSRAGIFAHANQLRDMGPFPGQTGVLNSVSALFAKDDHLDPYFVSGVKLSLPGWNVWNDRFEIDGSVSMERDRSAALEVSDDDGDFRPVRPIDPGDMVAADVSAGTPPREVGFEARTELRYGIFDSQHFQTARLDLSLSREAVWQRFTVGSAVHLGFTSDQAPSQELFLLGGQGTLLGHPYRAFVGDRFWLVDGHASRMVFDPWVSVRAFGAAGWTELRQERVLPLRWHGTSDGGVKATLGLGLGLGWDIVHADLGRGLDGGSWEFAISAARRFRSWL